MHKLQENRFFQATEPLLKVVLNFRCSMPQKTLIEIRKSIQSILFSTLPQKFFPNSIKEEVVDWFKMQLPNVRWSFKQPHTFCVSLLSWDAKRDKPEKYFFEMFESCFLPNQAIQVKQASYLRFFLPRLSKESLLLCHGTFLIESLPNGISLNTKIEHAAKEIEAKIKITPPLPLLNAQLNEKNSKNNMILIQLNKLCNRFHRIFAQDLLARMNLILFYLGDDFVVKKSYHNLGRIIYNEYFLRKKLQKQQYLKPHKRQVVIRFTESETNYPFGRKKVKGLLLGINFFNDQEELKKEQIIEGIKKQIGAFRVLQNTFISFGEKNQLIQTFYLEIEKENGVLLNTNEVKKLKLSLPKEIESRVSLLIPAICGMRNEEEIMRNILILSKELDSPNSLPQAILSYDYHTDNSVTFRVIILRAVRKDMAEIQSLLPRIDQPLILLERKQFVGIVQPDILKEALVLRISIDRGAIPMRNDSSINLYFAREKVVSTVTACIGEFRDYNGGLILKQSEQFAKFKCLFPKEAIENRDLLEDFFFSITPIETQATIPVTFLKLLFEFFLENKQAEVLNEQEAYLKVLSKDESVFIYIQTTNEGFKRSLLKQMEQYHFSLEKVVTTEIKRGGILYLGMVYTHNERVKRDKFIDLVRRTVDTFLKNRESCQVLRLNFIDFPISMDPRIGGDDVSTTFGKMLFEGLMRIGKDQKPHPAIARSFEISDNKKRYVFKLRDSFWSNGTKLVAYDFEYAWKKILSPSFETPFDYFFYPIKNAKQAKKGEIDLKKVGIQAVTLDTFIVDLEHPTPYFLELLAHPLYSPVNHQVDIFYPTWASEESNSYVCNGPFCLEEKRATHYRFIRNPHYWDREQVYLDYIKVIKTDATESLELYDHNHLDWLGRPMYPWHPEFNGSAKNPLSNCWGNGVYWIIFNTQAFPFSNKSMRQAIAGAINRNGLLEFLGYSGEPAFTPLPKQHSFHSSSRGLEGDRKKALRFFKRALDELELDRNSLPPFTWNFSSSKLRKDIGLVIKKQIEEVFNHLCHIEFYDWPVYFKNICDGNYQIGGIYWRPWIDDPMYTLSSFIQGEQKVNFSHWEHSSFQRLIDQANRTVDILKRNEYLQQAEAILIEEVVVVPLFYEFNTFKVKSHLSNYWISPTGYVDFKSALISKKG